MEIDLANLPEDAQALKALVHAIAQVAPTGMQASFGSRAIISAGGVQVGHCFFSLTMAVPDHSKPARPTEMP